MSFNPRTHTGCDQRVWQEAHSKCCFNPRTHTGCDAERSRNMTGIRSFQSTHPHGVRLSGSVRSAPPVWCFNPRTHTGCDCIYSTGSFCPMTFQSTHPHGVRRIQYRNDIRNLPVSIHAPTRGATAFRARVICKD